MADVDQTSDASHEVTHVLDDAMDTGVTVDHPKTADVGDSSPAVETISDPSGEHVVDGVTEVFPEATDETAAGSVADVAQMVVESVDDAVGAETEPIVEKQEEATPAKDEANQAGESTTELDDIILERSGVVRSPPEVCTADLGDHAHCYHPKEKQAVETEEVSSEEVSSEGVGSEGVSSEEQGSEEVSSKPEEVLQVSGEVGIDVKAPEENAEGEKVVESAEEN